MEWKSILFVKKIFLAARYHARFLDKTELKMDYRIRITGNSLSIAERYESVTGISIKNSRYLNRVTEQALHLAIKLLISFVSEFGYIDFRRTVVEQFRQTKLNFDKNS